MAGAQLASALLTMDKSGMGVFFFFMQKTAYELRISDWSSDVCSSDLTALAAIGTLALAGVPPLGGAWTKEAVIAAAGHEQKIVAVACMVAGGLSAAYALRLHLLAYGFTAAPGEGAQPDRKSTRLNSSH